MVDFNRIINNLDAPKVVKKDLKKPETPIMPSFSEEAFDPTTTSISEDGESDDDERDVDTSLNDDDEEWIKKHSD